MPTDDRREDGRVNDPQVRHAMDPQERIDDAPILPGRHARRARRVVQRLDALPYRVRDRVVVERMERVVERRVVRAERVDHRRERLRVREAREEARPAHERAHVVWRREVLWVDERRVFWVPRAQADCARA